MTKREYDQIRIWTTTKKHLDSLKGNKESYNDLIIRILKENERLNNILLNIEELKKEYKK